MLLQIVIILVIMSLFIYYYHKIILSLVHFESFFLGASGGAEKLYKTKLYLSLNPLT